jgi:RHS repeat-associated protein
VPRHLRLCVDRSSRALGRTTGRAGSVFMTQSLLALALAAAVAAVGSPAIASAPNARQRPARTELPELRTRTSTTYQNPNGTRTTEVSLGSVHYRDGVSWLPIDRIVRPAGDRFGYAWRNGTNAFASYFKARTAGDYLRLETQDHVLTFALEDANPLAFGVALGSRLSYGAVFPAVDLRYTMLADGIKEEFVLADASGPAHYRFQMSVADGGPLEAEQQADGSWTFFSAPETPLFSIPAPFAREARDRYGRAATHAALDVQGSGTDFSIDLDIDPAWLQDPERQFPVIVDPGITVQPPTLDDDFEYPCQAPQGQSCTFPGTLQLGIGAVRDPEPLDPFSVWSAMEFSNLGIPSNAYVVEALAELWFEHGSCFEVELPAQQQCHAHTIDVHKMTADWSTSTRTESLGYAGTPLDSYALPADAASDWMSWDIKGTAQGWVDGTVPNYGLLFKRNPDIQSPANGPVVPGSGWPDDPTLRPMLEITYHLPPNQPTLSSPASGAALDLASPVLAASATDPDEDPLSLRFQVASDAGFSTIVADSGSFPITSGSGTYTVSPGALKDGRTYYWRVQAEDDFQTGPWSATRSFDIRLRKLGIRDYWPIWSHGPLAVNEANGNLVLSLPGPSYPYGTNSMSASVSYNSQAPTSLNQGLGQGWTLDTSGAASPPAKLIDHNLLIGTDQLDAVERISGDGSSDYYTHVGGSNTYLATPGDGAQLTKNADGTWTLLDSDGAIYTFDPAAPSTGVAQLRKIEFVDEDPGQTPLYHCYDATSGKLASIRNTPDCGSPNPTRQLQFVWNSVNPALCPGALLCLSGPDFVTWRYVGESGGGTTGRIASVNDGTRDLVAITYAANGGLPNKIQNANDLDWSHASPGYNKDHALTIAYDAGNRVSSVSDGPVSNQTPATSTWSFTYNAPCPVAPAATRAAHAGHAQGWLRDNEGCTDRKPPRQQGQQNIVRTHYDSLGRRIQVTDLLGGITMAGYDERDQQLWSEDEDGNPTDITYADVEGNATTNPWVATARTTVTGPDPDGTGPLARPPTRSRYDETRMGEDTLTTSGGLITDAVRLAGTDGDGRASPDSSFGIWEGTTNLVLNGGFETNTAGWSAINSTISRFALRSKFGSACGRATTNGAANYGMLNTISLSGPTAGKPFSGSAWVYAEGSAVGKNLRLLLRETGGQKPFSETSADFTLAAGWQRVKVTRTLVQSDRTGLELRLWRNSGAVSGEYFDADGAQIENKALATPYVQTNGATASRAAGRVQAPSTLLSGTTGWVAVRFRAGIASSSANVRLFTWGASASDELYLRYGSGSFRMGRVISGTASEAVQAASFAPGDTVTVIGAWWHAGLSDFLKVSVNGAPFATLTSGGTSQPAGTMFDFGQRGYSPQDFANSDLLWAAAGPGTLTNADATTINLFGAETPGTWSYPPAATASAVWTADTAAYQQPLPTAGPSLQGLQAAYYENENLAGRPKVLQNDSNVDFNWGTGAPAPLPGRSDNFSVRWSGYLKVASEGDYTFATYADDGTRLTIDGSAAINNWVAQSATQICSQPLHLTGGLHKLVLEYFEGLGTANVTLKWSGAGCGTVQAIPATALRPAWFNQTSSVSPAGRTGFSHFPNPANARSDYSLSRLLDGTNLITSFSYDAYGRVTQKVMPKGNADRTIDANGTLQGSPDTTFATTYTYYAPGDTSVLPLACNGPGPTIDQAQLLKSTAPRGIATQTFVYDAAGRQTAVTNGVGTICSTYDAEGRPTSTNAPGDAQATIYSYDPAGAQRTAADASGTVSSEYDEQGRAKRSLDSFGAEAKFKYDEEGNLSCRIASNGALPAGEASCTAGTNYTTNYIYDAKSRLTRLTDPTGRPYSFFYDTRGNLKATWYEANHTFSWNDYNALGGLTAVYNRHGDLSAPLPSSVPSDVSPLADFAYSYEQDGKKTQQVRTGGGLTSETESYRYDTLGRMEAVTLPNGTFRRYSFDLDSNRTQITENGSTTATYTYNPADPNSQGVDQLTSASESGPTRTFAYRSDGEMTARGSDSLTWDGWGRLTGGTFPGTTVTYSFDPVGFRRQRVGGGTTTRYLHGGMFETDGAGAITLTDVDGVAGDLAHFAGAPTTGSTVTYLYYNGHGDLAAEADSAGTRTNAFTYDPFGAPKQTQPADKAVERWTGRWDKKLETASGLIEMGARPYDPNLGRFLAIDPVEGGSLNGFDYANQDPTNSYDLDGTEANSSGCRMRWVCMPLLGCFFQCQNAVGITLPLKKRKRQGSCTVRCAVRRPGPGGRGVVATLQTEAFGFTHNMCRADGARKCNERMTFLIFWSGRYPGGTRAEPGDTIGHCRVIRWNPR